MASDITTLNQVVSSFQQLPIDEQIAALAVTYQEIAGSLPSVASPATGSQQVEDIVKRVLDMREGGQIQFLQDVLKDSDHNEVALDINPSKAMLELIPGDGIEAPLEEYNKLSGADRLMVWYRLASQMGNDFIGIPKDYALSDAAKQVLQSLQSYSGEEKINFLSQLV